MNLEQKLLEIELFEQYPEDYKTWIPFILPIHLYIGNDPSINVIKGRSLKEDDYRLLSANIRVYWSSFYLLENNTRLHRQLVFFYKDYLVLQASIDEQARNSIERLHYHPKWFAEFIAYFNPWLQDYKQGIEKQINDHKAFELARYAPLELE